MGRVPVTYVRHAMAVQVEGVHPTEWALDSKGKGEAEALARRLEVEPVIGALVSSDEPKAEQTAREIGAVWGAAVSLDPRLREAVRPWIGPGYRAVAHRYLRGELPDGWEPHADVEKRMAAAVDDAVERAGGDQVVVVAHGLCLALHLGHRLGPRFDRESFWSALAFPDAWVLDQDLLLHRPHRATAVDG